MGPSTLLDDEALDDDDWSDSEDEEEDLQNSVETLKLIDSGRRSLSRLSGTSCRRSHSRLSGRRSHSRLSGTPGRRSRLSDAAVQSICEMDAQWCATNPPLLS